MHLTLEQQLELLRLSGHDVLIKAPPEYEAVWQRALDEGIRLGKLYVLRSPLQVDTGGSYNRDTGDIYVVHSSRDTDLGIKALLHELAHAQRQPRAARTIDEYWDEEGRTYSTARALALKWRVSTRARTEEWLEARLEEVEVWRERMHQAGRLAGSIDLSVTRAALSAILRIGHKKRWDDRTLEDALYGTSEDEATNAAAVDFDRCTLRGSWSLPDGRDRGFGRYALPQTDTTERWLRDTLEGVASGRGRVHPAREGRTYSWAFAALEVSDGTALTDAVSLCNSALLANPAESIYVVWWLYTDEGIRIYCLSIAHTGGKYTELWMPCMETSARGRIAEAALQRYILSWNRCTAISISGLSEGLRTLCAQLRYAFNTA